MVLTSKEFNEKKKTQIGKVEAEQSVSTNIKPEIKKRYVLHFPEWEVNHITAFDYFVGEKKYRIEKNLITVFTSDEKELLLKKGFLLIKEI